MFSISSRFMSSHLSSQSTSNRKQFHRELCRNSMAALCGTGWKTVRGRVMYVTCWSGPSQLDLELVIRTVETKGLLVGPRMIRKLRSQEDHQERGGARPPSIKTL